MTLRRVRPFIFCKWYGVKDEQVDPCDGQENRFPHSIGVVAVDLNKKDVK